MKPECYTVRVRFVVYTSSNPHKYYGGSYVNDVLVASLHAVSYEYATTRVYEDTKRYLRSQI